MDSRYPIKVRALCLALARIPMENACQLADALKDNKEVLDCLAHFLLKKLPLAFGDDGHYRVSTGVVDHDPAITCMMGFKDEDIASIAEYSKETENPKSIFRSSIYIGETAMEALMVLTQFVVKHSHRN